MSNITPIFSDFVYEDTDEELAYELLPICKQLLSKCGSDNRYLNGTTTFYSEDPKVNNFQEWDYPVLDKFYEFVLKNVEEYIETMKIKFYTKPKLTHVWISEMREGGSHEFHVHGNSWISGNFFVKIPYSSAKLVFQRPNYGFDMWSGANFWKPKTINNIEYSFSPSVGKLLLFKSSMIHGVRHNYSDSRICISFNIDLVRD